MDFIKKNWWWIALIAIGFVGGWFALGNDDDPMQKVRNAKAKKARDQMFADLEKLEKEETNTVDAEHEVVDDGKT